MTEPPKCPKKESFLARVPKKKKTEVVSSDEGFERQMIFKVKGLKEGD